MEQFIQIISTVGFPIACCMGLFWMINNTLKQMQETIDNNTKVMNELLHYTRGGTE